LKAGVAGSDVIGFFDFSFSNSLFCEEIQGYCVIAILTPKSYWVVATQIFIYIFHVHLYRVGEPTTN